MSSLDDLSKGLQKLAVEEESAPVPPWLQSTQGKNPVLSADQFNFIAQIRSQVSRQNQPAGLLSEKEIRKVKETVQTMKNNFEQVVEEVRMSGKSKTLFMEKYPQWENFRRKNIKNLKEIAAAIGNDAKNCQSSKIAGSFVSLLGGGLCLIASGGNGQIAGSVMMGLGSLTSSGTSAVEALLLRENINKANEITRLEKKYMVDLLAFLRGASCLHKAMDNIKSLNYEESWLGLSEKFHSIFKKDPRAKDKEREIKMTLKSSGIPPEVAEEISNVVGILVATCMLFERYFFLFKIAFKSYDVVSRLRLSVDLCRGAIIGMNAVSTAGQRTELTDGQKTAIWSGMALDAANILFLALQDSKSVEAQEIRKIVNQLEREAGEFKRLYQEMESLDIN